MYYLASPYTHADPEIVQDRYEAAMQATAELTRLGLVVFSPIVHSHPMGVQHDLPGDWPFWERIDREFIRRSDGIILLMLDGWDESVGVTAELDFAQALRLPVYYQYSEMLAAEIVEQIAMLQRGVLLAKIGRAT